MRRIKKTAEPNALTKFRAECKSADKAMKEEKARNRATDPGSAGATLCHFCGSGDRKSFLARDAAEVTCLECGAKPRSAHYALIDAELRKGILQSLLDEQGWLCAYTGLKICEDEHAGVDAHVEHLKAQESCAYGEDVQYSNIVACYPRPNRKVDAPYGAVPKKNWPDHSDSGQVALFISPLSNGCESRFKFAVSGRISPGSPTDAAAIETIRRLHLDHAELTEYRKAAIRATLSSRGKPFSLDIAAAQRRLNGLRMDEQAGKKLEPFCFVLKQAIEGHIKQITVKREANLKQRGSGEKG
jgi:uncharacterized protein (TIGR02646 family)